MSSVLRFRVGVLVFVLVARVAWLWAPSGSGYSAGEGRVRKGKVNATTRGIPGLRDNATCQLVFSDPMTVFARIL